MTTSSSEQGTRRTTFRKLALVYFALLILILLVKILTVGQSTTNFFGQELDRSQLLVRLVQALVGLPVSHLIPILERLFRVRISQALEELYLLFLFLALGLGSCLGFFVRFYHWDKMTHFYAAALLSIAGYGFWNCSLEGTGVRSYRQLGMGYLLAFSFSGLISLFWELFEYTADGIYPALNTQRYMDLSGVALVGRAALEDTMGDIIFNTIGGLFGIIFLIIWQRLKRGQGFDQQLNIDWQRSLSQLEEGNQVQDTIF